MAMKHLVAAAKAAHRKHKHIGKINKLAATRRGRSYVTKQKMKSKRFESMFKPRRHA